jgi:2-polyprenyl-3-methyl-5-hydroxy-6-metoxy-1,4-benzoquinol methylase
LVFANPLPTAEQLDQYYSDAGAWAAPRAERLERIEKSYLRKAAKPPRPGRSRRVKPPAPPGGPERLLNAIAPYLPVDTPPPGAKVLDFGCGDGKLLNRFQERGWRTYGIEPSTHVPFIRHTRLETPPQDGSFDLIVLHHVLEHVLNPLDVLQQLSGSVRIGGSVLISVPRLDTLPVHRDLNYCIDARRHIMSFTERCMTGLLARAGFDNAARLDLPELDQSHTEGQPKRLRLIATRVAAPLPPPAMALAPAIDALRQFRRRSRGIKGLGNGLLPVRIRGALIERARERAAQARRAERLSETKTRAD